MIKITITCKDIDDILEEPQFGVRPWFKADFFSMINTAVDHFKNKHEGNAMDIEGFGINIQIEEQVRKSYIIDILKIGSSYGKMSEAEHAKVRQVLLDAAQDISGETEIEVFKTYTKRLEKAFKTNLMTFFPSDPPVKWRIHLPESEFTDARVSVLFDIKEKD